MVSRNYPTDFVLVYPSLPAPQHVLNQVMPFHIISFCIIGSVKYNRKINGIRIKLFFHFNHCTIYRLDKFPSKMEVSTFNYAIPFSAFMATNSFKIPDFSVSRAVSDISIAGWNIFIFPSKWLNSLSNVFLEVKYILCF